MNEEQPRNESNHQQAPSSAAPGASKPSMLHRILQLQGSAHSIALGTAIGLFVAMTPTVGLQMIIILIISLLIPANRLAGFIMVYISNPLTMVPIYWLGRSEVPRTESDHAR